MDARVSDAVSGATPSSSSAPSTIFNNDKVNAACNVAFGAPVRDRGRTGRRLRFWRASQKLRRGNAARRERLGGSDEKKDDDNEDFAGNDACHEGTETPLTLSSPLDLRGLRHEYRVAFNKIRRDRDLFDCLKMCSKIDNKIQGTIIASHSATGITPSISEVVLITNAVTNVVWLRALCEMCDYNAVSCNDVSVILSKIVRAVRHFKWLLLHFIRVEHICRKYTPGPSRLRWKPVLSYVCVVAEMLSVAGTLMAARDSQTSADDQNVRLPDDCFATEFPTVKQLSEEVDRVAARFFDVFADDTEKQMLQQRCRNDIRMWAAVAGCMRHPLFVIPEFASSFFARNGDFCDASPTAERLLRSGTTDGGQAAAVSRTASSEKERIIVRWEGFHKMSINVARGTKNYERAEPEREPEPEPEHEVATFDTADEGEKALPPLPELIDESESDEENRDDRRDSNTACEDDADEARIPQRTNDNERKVCVLESVHNPARRFPLLTLRLYIGDDDDAQLINDLFDPHLSVTRVLRSPRIGTIWNVEYESYCSSDVRKLAWSCRHAENRASGTLEVQPCEAITVKGNLKGMRDDLLREVVYPLGAEAGRLFFDHVKDTYYRAYETASTAATEVEVAHAAHNETKAAHDALMKSSEERVRTSEKKADASEKAAQSAISQRDVLREVADAEAHAHRARLDDALQQLDGALQQLEKARADVKQAKRNEAEATEARNREKAEHAKETSKKTTASQKQITHLQNEISRYKEKLVAAEREAHSAKRQQENAEKKCELLLRRADDAEKEADGAKRHIEASKTAAALMRKRVDDAEAHASAIAASLTDARRKAENAETRSEAADAMVAKLHVRVAEAEKSAKEVRARMNHEKLLHELNLQQHILRVKKETRAEIAGAGTAAREQEEKENEVQELTALLSGSGIS